jgi:sensor domain DACNV-containing protein
VREPRYPAARSVAARLEAHFAREAPSGTLAPDAAAIEALVDAGFWASLQREEGYVPEISLAFLPPDEAVRPLRLRPPLPLDPHTLAQLSPAVERPGIHLGVWRSGGELRVWGTTRTVPPYCFVLEVIAPGLLVVKHRVREDSAKFRNVAVFQGDEVKLLGQGARVPSEHSPLLRPLLAPESAEGSADVLLRLAVSMRAHRRGGTLLVVPAGDDSWRESIVRPIGYAVDPPFTELGEMLEGAAAASDADRAAVARAVDALAGLTAVDGATLITDRFELLAFGVKIARPDGQTRVERVCVTEPIEGGRSEVVAPLSLGGTRHISGAQFAQDQKRAVALVASQDGRFTVFAWCEREGMVHAHRVEALLL